MIRLALAQASELGRTASPPSPLTPGFLRSEAMLDHFGVTEANWRDGIAKDPHFALSETPAYVGRAVAALAADPDVHALERPGAVLLGARPRVRLPRRRRLAPDWGAHYAEHVIG